MLGEESPEELWQDMLLGVAFLVLAAVALRRLLACMLQGGTEVAVLTFYALIFVASAVRAIWFAIPTAIWAPTYAPTALYAFVGPWVGTYLMSILLFVGSLSLFSIFIMMANFWKHLLQGIYKVRGRRSRPMKSFATAAVFLVAVEVLNSSLFFAGVYNSQGMLMFESLLLLFLSVGCSVEISRYSHRFRTVLSTLAAVNQISTDSQVKRIIRITIIANLFFAVRAACELTLAVFLYLHYRRHHTWDFSFDSNIWDPYVLIKHATEALVLALMLWLLYIPDDGVEEEAAHEDQAEEEAEGQGEGGLSAGGEAVVGVYDPGRMRQEDRGDGEGYWRIQPDDSRDVYLYGYGVANSSEDLMRNGGFGGAADAYGAV